MLAAERNRFMVRSAGASRWTLAPFRQAYANRLFAGVTGFPTVRRTTAFRAARAPGGKGAGRADARRRVAGLARNLPDNPGDVRRAIIAAALAGHIRRPRNSRTGHPVRIFAGAGSAGPVPHIPDIHVNAPLCNSNGFAEVNAGTSSMSGWHASKKQEAYCCYSYSPEVLFHGPPPLELERHHFNKMQGIYLMVPHNG